MVRRRVIQQDLFNAEALPALSIEQIKNWMILDAIPNLQKRTIFKLLTKHSINDLLKLSFAQLQGYRLKEEQIKALLHPDLARITENVAWRDESKNRYIICFDDVRYPMRLKEISNPPLLLYVQGDIELLQTPQIALVGSRNCTPYGRDKAYQFSRDLVSSGFTVTSGLAIGIDGFAHQGALDGAGKTIAVLGTGLNNIYPKRHMKLAQQIIEKGVLVSEFWPNSPAIPSNFPRRNRLISGLSLGVLVIEASKRSGSLITARYASEQNRDLFALPGSIDNAQASGCHHLIQQGAKLVTNITDISEEFEHLIDKGMRAVVGEVSSNEDKHPLLTHIDFHLTTIEQLLSRSGLDIVTLQNQLIELEITGRISVTAEGYMKGNNKKHV